MSADRSESLGAVARRLLVAAVLSAAIAGVCWWLLPKAGMYVPWYVPDWRMWHWSHTMSSAARIVPRRSP